MNRKAIALLSGGLDSSLAVKMMIGQGIKEILGEKESFFSVDRKFDKEALAMLQVEAIKF